MQSFEFEGHRIAYREHGSGDRVLVMTHGLLMNQGMFTALAPAIAKRGFRVITIDLLGHGDSDQPADTASYSMTLFARQIIALLDHLGLEQAVVGGTSLGANVSLEISAIAPERVRGMVIEMPVLENGLIAAAVAFTPLGALLFVNRWGMGLLARAARAIPRSHYLLDIGLDWARRNPESSLAVLLGIQFGRVAPPASERRSFEAPTLIIGHPNDPLHPFSDADMLVHELPNARLVNAKSALEWRFSPRRLNDELARFLDDVYASEQTHPEPAVSVNGR